MKRHFMRHATLGLALSTPLVLLGAVAQAGDTTAEQAKTQTDVQKVLALPLGDQAGQASTTTTIPNPYQHDPQAVQQGHDLFIAMNCAGCHGYGATGGMGPNLTDTYWRYGSVPASIFKSIYEGRPEGMPAWNPTLPPQEIWKLVAYIESLGGTLPASDYQAWMQGDHPSESATPKQGGAPPQAPPNPDSGPPPGSKQ
jgi:cytochrome c oxidase cbb3-type subunit III